VGTDIVNMVLEPGALPQSAPITEDVFGAGNTLLGEKMLTESSGFLGVTSSTLITKVTFFSDCESDCSSLLSNLSIVTPAAETPLPAALPLFATGLGVAGLLARRRKQKATPGQFLPDFSIVESIAAGATGPELSISTSLSLAQLAG
jgi:hypothetical protein